MLEYARLEWRKDRTLFGGMAAAFLLSLPVVGLIARLNHHAVSWGIDAALLFWTFVGLPIAAVVFGAAIASALRGEPAAAAESPLPISPRGRVFGAAAAGLAGLAGMIVLVLAVSATISPDWRVAVTQHDFASVMVVPYFSVELFVLLHLFLLAFAMSYLFAHGVAGGAAAVPLGGLTAAALTRDYALHSLFGPRVPLWPTMAIVMLVCAGGAAAVIGWAAPWRQRLERRGWRAGARIAAVLAAGAFVSFIGAGTFNHRMARSPQFLREGESAWKSLTNEAASPKARRAANEGVLMESLDGMLIRVRPEGASSLLIAAKAHAEDDLLSDPYGTRTLETSFDPEGRLWVARKAGAEGPTEIWSGSVEGPLRKQAVFTGVQLISLDASVGPVVLLGTRPGPETERWVSATLGEAGAKVDWRPAGAIDRINEWILRRRAAAGAAALLSADRRRLTWSDPVGGSRTWRLPAPAAGKDPVDAEFIGGSKVFLVPIKLAKDRMALAVCRLDGSVDIKWKDEAYISNHWFDLPDGSIWSWAGTRRFLVISNQGEFLPELRFESDYSGPLVHLEGGFAWMLEDDKFVSKVDLSTSRVVARWTLPDSRAMNDHFLSPVRLTARGLFVRTSRDLFFYDWDGRRKRIAL